MNTVADETLYRIKQDVRTRYGIKSYSTEDDKTKQQMLDDLEFLINENKLLLIQLEEKSSKQEIDDLENNIDDLENDIEIKDETIERLIKYLNKHIVSIPDWIEEIADENGVELE